MKKKLFMLQELEEDTKVEGPFFVIDAFWIPSFSLDEDGSVKTFDTYEDAVKTASDCQHGYVIKI